MRRALVATALALALGVAAVLAHFALIETAGEVALLRTREPDGTWLDSRLWIVDHAGRAWLHGADSRWMRNLKARPEVQVVRGGRAGRYRATPVPGPHPEIHARLRAKYGLADRWVRLIGPDGEATMPVRLDPLPER
jgi:hypothetical protein